jgi:hemolysin activation/secretion protein
LAGRAVSGLIFLALLQPVAVVAGAGDIPDAARPGAIRPLDDERRRVPLPPPDAVIEIPPLIDRPLDIDEGERVIVQRFELEGAVDRPEHKIFIEQIKTILEGQREARPEGFTIGRLEEAAAAVTNYYRQRGLILAQAVIPVQTVDDGVVTVEVLEGKLGRVLAEGNEIYNEAVLTRPFQHLIGQPVTQRQVESALLTLTDFPGLSVFGVFQPGVRVGEADIVLKVQKEDRFDFALRGDNHGTQETGRNRLRATVEWNNPTGSADRLAVTAQQTFTPRNNLFYSFDYDRYLGRGFRLGGFFSRNEFDVGGEFADRNISAETDFYGVFLDKNFIRSREHNLSSRLGLTHKRSRTTTDDIQTNRDRLTVFSLSATYDSVDTRFSGLNFAFLELSQGVNNFLGSMGDSDSAANEPLENRPSRQGGPPDMAFAEGEFTKLFGMFSRLQTVTRHTSLLFRAEGQWSPDLLVPVEQYSIGGPDNVRSYPLAQALFDQAWFLSFEYIINAPFIADAQAFGHRTWGELIQFSVFYDAAAGRLNDPLPTEPQGFVSYQGAGWGLRFNLPGTIESRLLMAWKIGAQEPDNNRFPQLWADFTYRF